MYYSQVLAINTLRELNWLQPIYHSKAWKTFDHMSLHGTLRSTKWTTLFDFAGFLFAHLLRIATAAYYNYTAHSADSNLKITACVNGIKYFLM